MNLAGRVRGRHNFPENYPNLLFASRNPTVMEIRCSQCDHLGEAAEVRPVDEGVGLVCGQCGHVNVAATSESNDDADREPSGQHPGAAAVAASIDDTAESGRSAVADSLKQMGADALFGKTSEVSSPELNIGDEFVETSIQRLIPKPGDGPRCRKCLALFDESTPEHCSQCGLSVVQADQYAPGQAPWEVAPEGKQDEQQQARRLWEAVYDDEQPQTLDEFVEYTVDEGLIDFGIRTVQKRLIEAPDDREAIEALTVLAEKLEVAVELAKTQAESRSEQFQEDVKQFRSKLLIGALVFWTVLFFVFSWLFFDVF